MNKDSRFKIQDSRFNELVQGSKFNDVYLANPWNFKTFFIFL